MIEESHKLGDVLRAARETKGVDLTRVERDTKIRERYLSALERGDYRDLPGSVYTKGFLRNYGAYLGLDPEYLIDLYRLETSSAAAERPRMPSPPRPLSTRRSRAFVVTPGVVVAAILTILVGGFVAYLGYEFVNFARTPELRITDPVGNVSAHPSLTITVRGTTAPNARITVSNLRENPTVTADADGRFEVILELVPGSNVIRLVARDPLTNRDSEPEERTVVVAGELDASPSPTTIAFALAEPLTDATFAGPIPIRGSAAPGTTVRISLALVTAPTPSFTVRDGAGGVVALAPPQPGVPGPLDLVADASGAFVGELVVPAGTWDVTASPADGEAATRQVVVGPGDGLRVRLRLNGGDSYLEVDEDGEPVADVSGSVAEDGTGANLAADETVRIRAGNAGAVRLSINGISIGAMGPAGAVVEWRITRNEE